jgi:AcrR family transcriptional regulator
MIQQTDLDKRQAILHAMLDLVAEHGFHGAPMSLLAKHAGVSAGIIYHYFDGKEEVIHALYAEIKGRFSAALVQGDPHLLPFPDHLKQMWLNAYQFYVAHPRETRFLEQYENSPFQHNWDIDSLDANFRLLVGMIEQDFADGHIRPMPFEVLYELTVGVALGLAKRRIAGGIDLSAEALAEAAEACCRAVSR